MRVNVLFFGMLRDLAGRTTEQVELTSGATVGDLLGYYTQTVPRMGSFVQSIAISVNAEYVRKDCLLHDGDEVALLPPVSGGSDAATGANSTERAMLVRERIDTQRVVESLKQAADGAVVVFDGIVRDNSRGRRTLYLDYDAYEPLALKQLERLAAETLDRFAVRAVKVVHRLGRIEVGETSVLIVVLSAHRAAAFDACRWLIDTLKKTVPIWKKEHFEDGAVWADGEPFPPEITAGLSGPADANASAQDKEK